MAGDMDWSTLLTNQSNQDEIIMEEKDEYGKYAVEIPYSNGKFKIKTGILESEELWLKLSNVFYPVFGTKDFSKFSIPFKCIATNAANGQAVVLDKGEIVTAVRSSMAIPSIFTAVRLDSMKLVDGGVVRNFPVEDVKAMGADFVIGVNVSAGLSPTSQLNNPIAILMNAVFFKAAEDAKKEIPLCNIYIPMPVENFSTGAFNRSAAIIDTGVDVGNRLYPMFKKLKDSLDAIYGYQPPPGPRLPEIKDVLISEVEVDGLVKTSKDFFLEFMGFELNKEYGPDDIGLMIRRGFGHRYYDRITYELESLPDGKTKIKFLVSENPLAAAKMSVHFNKFSGLALIANLPFVILFLMPRVP
jgi:NTE family protein